MNANPQSFVAPITPEQQRHDAALHEHVRSDVEGVVRAALETDRSPEAVVKLAADASHAAERLTAQYRHPASPPVACQSGCSWCCHQMVKVTAPEVFRVVRFLESAELPVPRAALVERVKTLNKITRGMTPLARTKIPKPCAFLSEAGQCAVYAARPLACAEFSSYDAKACKRAHRVGFKPGLVVHEKARLIAYSAVQNGLSDGLQKALPQADTKWLELTAAVVQVLATDRAEERWLAGENIFAGAHTVA